MIGDDTISAFCVLLSIVFALLIRQLNGIGQAQATPELHRAVHRAGLCTPVMERHKAGCQFYRHAKVAYDAALAGFPKSLADGTRAQQNS